MATLGARGVDAGGTGGTRARAALTYAPLAIVGDAQLAYGGPADARSLRAVRDQAYLKPSLDGTLALAGRAL
jgi:hypothetical protein